MGVSQDRITNKEDISDFMWGLFDNISAGKNDSTAIVEVDKYVKAAVFAKSPQDRKYFTGKIQYIPGNIISEQARKDLETVLVDDRLINWSTIIVCGYLEIGELERFEELAREYEATTSYKSLAWASLLVLARRGDEKSNRIVLDRIKSEERLEYKFTLLPDDLAYLNNQGGLDVLIELLMDDATYMDVPNQEPYKWETFLYAHRIPPVLKEIILNFPQEAKYRDAQEVRKWIKAGKYELDKTAYIPLK